jgi:hypothetical protein
MAMGRSDNKAKWQKAKWQKYKAKWQKAKRNKAKWQVAIFNPNADVCRTIQDNMRWLASFDSLYQTCLISGCGWALTRRSEIDELVTLKR